MRSISGHVLSTEAVVKVRSRKGALTGPIEVQGQQIARVESRMVPTVLAWTNSSRSSVVIFPDQSRWLIHTGPPDEPVVTKRVLGISYQGKAGLDHRVARVTDERERLLAEAVWPNPKVQKQMMRRSMTRHGPNALERLAGWFVRFTTTAPRITVGDQAEWYLPVEIPGRFGYGSRLGESLTVLSNRKTMRLIPDEPVPLEAAVLCWHIEIGDVYVRTSGGGG